MSTSVALSSVAVAQSSIAIAEAEHAQIVACQGFVRGFENDKATTAQMRQYASCVQRLYPEAISPDGMVAIKVLIALLLLSIPIGGYLSWKRDEDSMLAVLGALLAPCVIGMAAVVLGLIGWGIQVLFS